MLAMPTTSSVRRNDCSQLINRNGWPKLQDLNGLSLYSGGGDSEGINNVHTLNVLNIDRSSSKEGCCWACP
jgi:hypothetical protein